MWKFVIPVLIAIGTLNALPVSEPATIRVPADVQPPATELLPPKEDAEVTNYGEKSIVEREVEPTLATELLPPKEDAEVGFSADKPAEEEVAPMMPRLFGPVFIVNVYAVKNMSAEATNDVLSDETLESVPDLTQPLATVLLVTEEGDISSPVSLDDLAKDLEEEGLQVEKIADENGTALIKVNFEGIEEDIAMISPGKLNKVRRRRSPHPHGKLLSKLFGGGGGGGCSVCQSGGGGYPQAVIPVQISYQPQPQYQQYQQPRPQYHQPRPQYQQQPQYVQPNYIPQGGGGGCNRCGGGGGGGGGNHGSYSQSSAQASAQSSSGSW